MAKRRTRTVTRYVRRRGGGGKRGFTLPIAVVAGFLPEVMGAVAQAPNGPRAVAEFVSESLTGWSINQNRWYPQFLRFGLVPILGGIGVHMLASKLGVNRMIARAGVPFVRI